MNDSADYSALVLTHKRKVLEAADVLGEARVRLLTAAMDDVYQVQSGAREATRHADELMREALRLSASAERLVAEARAILSECGPATVENSL